MKCFHIEARDLPDCWFQVVDLCYREGRDYLITEGSYAGQKRKQLDYVTLHIKFPQTRPLLPDIPAHYNIPNPVEEDYIEKYLPYLLTSKVEPNEEYSYGQRLFSPAEKVIISEDYSYVDAGILSKNSQVEEVIAKFKRGFGTNQCSMSISQPSDIHLKDPPCLRTISCSIFPEEEPKKLHLFLTFRSWDLWNGLPANLAGLAHLQEYMAQEIGVETGEIVASSNGLHLYNHVWTLAKIRLGET